MEHPLTKANAFWTYLHRSPKWPPGKGNGRPTHICIFVILVFLAVLAFFLLLVGWFVGLLVGWLVVVVDSLN